MDRLELEENDLGPEGALYIRDVLRVNTNLSYLVRTSAFTYTDNSTNACDHAKTEH